MGFNELLQILFATVGTLGFTIVFNIRGKNLFFAAFGGCLSWVVYLLLGFIWEDVTLRFFLVSFVVSLYAELIARLQKAPTITFNIVALIPLVPGSSLYYSMTNAMEGNITTFLLKATETLKMAAALSAGMVLVNTFSVYIKKHRAQKHDALKQSKN